MKPQSDLNDKISYAAWINLKKAALIAAITAAVISTVNVYFYGNNLFQFTLYMAHTNYKKYLNA